MDEIRALRLVKREELLKDAKEPYGRKFVKTADIQALVDHFQEGREVQVAGRVMLLRGHGKTMFADLRDHSGKIQVYLRKDTLGEEQMALAAKIDMGDILAVSGSLFITKSGEKTVMVQSFKFLSKTLLPLPEKFHGLKDKELRYRQRYLDLIMNPEVRDRFRKRSEILKLIRAYLDERHFMEVETPMMQAVAGGAAAKPFVTYHNALDRQLYLRIAPELYLKRLLVGGFEKVYEINRNFRNEGISPRHNPEFTMLELYSAYDNYEDMMAICEDMVVFLAKKLLPESKVVWDGPGGAQEISLEKPWRRLSMKDAIKEYAHIDMDQEDFRSLAKKHGMDNGMQTSKEAVMAFLFEEFVEKKLIQPTFIIDFPTVLCPLCKTKGDNPQLSERFELFIAGQEIANAYSELNDPVEQAERFAHQAAGKEGDDVYTGDDDYVRALEYGMPPAGGLGVGIDRLVMLLTEVNNIREVILFPQLRKEVTDVADEAHEAPENA